MKSRRIVLCFAVAALAMFGLGGCVSVGVNVWERDLLSQPEMQFQHYAHERAIDDHIYFSKEASSGGRGFGGGGCGCN
jgi:hypothetical protein